MYEEAFDICKKYNSPFTNYVDNFINIFKLTTKIICIGRRFIWR